MGEQLFFSFLCIEKQKKNFRAIRKFLKFYFFLKLLSKFSKKNSNSKVFFAFQYIKN